MCDGSHSLISVLVSRCNQIEVLSSLTSPNSVYLGSFNAIPPSKKFPPAKHSICPDSGIKNPDTPSCWPKNVRSGWPSGLEAIYLMVESAARVHRSLYFGKAFGSYMYIFNKYS